MTVRGWVAATAVAGALAGCGTAPGTSSSTPTASVATSPSAGPSTVLRDADRGRTVTVHVGTTIELVLASTYWQVHPSSDAAVVAGTVAAVVSPDPLNGCVPGQGCGTVTAMFRAVASGTAALSATRAACGEALRCTGDAGTYTVTVVVTP